MEKTECLDPSKSNAGFQRTAFLRENYALLASPCAGNKRRTTYSRDEGVLLRSACISYIRALSPRPLAFAFAFSLACHLARRDRVAAREQCHVSRRHAYTRIGNLIIDRSLLPRAL
ncbi:hypothetical protein PUN28_000128 [Cardiocondyla obscurior]|uniref:Uncharacterized protein n=1 Tax=Cardiocondyla obscurior TaxID=286306 RepID=A0AAW2GY10_9HYME